MDGVLELQEFFVEGHEHDKSHVILHITEPSVGDLKKGYFFALAEVKNGSRDDIIELEKIFDDLEKSYYNTPHTTEKNALEVSLEFINRRANEVIKDTEAEIDCFVGVLENFHLTFSTHGNPLGFLFYTKDGKPEHLSLIDGEDQDKRHFFSSLTEGDLHTGDSLLLSNSQTNEFFDIDRLEKLILTRTNKESVEHIQKVLKQLRSGNSYGGVLLHSAHKHEVPKTGKKPRDMNEGSVASLHSLAQREKETSSTLSPPIFHETREKMKSFLEDKKQRNQEKEASHTGHETSHHDSRHEPHNQNREDTKSKFDIILTIGRILMAGVGGIVMIFVSFFRFFGSLFRGFFILLTNFRGKRPALLQNVRLSVRSKVDYLVHLPLLSKILFLLAVLSLGVFVASASYLRQNQIKQQNVQKYTNIFSAIEEKKNAAEASLLYDDSARAISLITEAQGYLTQLPASTPADEQKIQALKAELDSTLTKLQKMTLVTPEVFADLVQKNTTAKAERMIKIENTILITGKEDPTLYSINLDLKEITSQLHDTLPQLSASTLPKEQDKVVFVAGDANIVEFDQKSKTLSKKDISFPLTGTKLQSVAMYNRRLYSLDSANNQIFKHNQTPQGYDKGTPWITDETEVKNGVSIAIDGDMYVLNADGSMLKFTAGKRMEFSMSDILPALTAPTALWTNSDSPNIYILEPQTKRIVVIEKSGKFLKQFTASEWTSPSSFVVDEKGKKIYVLDGNKVYSFGF